MFKSVKVFIVILVMAFYGYSQDVIWSETYGGTNADRGRSVQETSDGGFIVTGYTESFGNGYRDIWLIKTDASGTEEWNQTFGGTGDDYGQCGRETSDGGFIVTGYTESFGSGGRDIWLIKTDASGAEEWNHTFGGTGADYAYSVQETSDGGFIVTGYTESFGSGGRDIWLIKTDASGAEEWNQTFGGTGSDVGRSVQQTSGGGFIVTGYSNSNTTGYNSVWLIKTDASGSEEWNQTYGGDFADVGWSGQETSEGGFIVTGYTDSFGSGDRDIWLIKTDANGAEEWNQTFGGTGMDAALSVDEASGGGYIIAGYKDFYGSGNGDVWLIKTDASGAEEWNQTFGGTGVDVAVSAQETSGGGYVIAGYTDSFGSGNNDVWLITVGWLKTTSIKFYHDVSANPTNPHNYISQGHPIRFKLEVESYLSTNILTGYGTIETETEGVTITEGNAVYNNILAESRAWSITEFEIIVDESVLSGTDITLSLSVEQQLDPTGPWTSSITFPVKPLEVSLTLLDDDSNPDSNGDNDGIIEPGESIELIPLIENYSDHILSDVWGTLSSDNSFVNIWNHEMGASDSVFDTYGYNVLSGVQQPINPMEDQIQPEVDFVFDYLGSQTQQINMGLIITATFDSILMKWDSEFLLNENEPVATDDTYYPRRFDLLPAFPNPFNPSTTLRYGLPQDSEVSMVIYDIRGNTVRTIESGAQVAGWYEHIWNGMNDEGQPVSTGLYLTRLRAGSYTKTIKMLYLK
jgi:hypothetical protein